MRLVLLLPALVLAGCAATPQQMAQQSNFDVCRFTMGGPHSAVADQEARRRGLNCQEYYPAITQRLQAENAAVGAFIQSVNPPAPAMRPTTTCQTVRIGNSLETRCF